MKKFALRLLPLEPKLFLYVIIIFIIHLNCLLPLDSAWIRSQSQTFLSHLLLMQRFELLFDILSYFAPTDLLEHTEALCHLNWFLVRVLIVVAVVSGVLGGSARGTIAWNVEFLNGGVFFSKFFWLLCLFIG